MGYMPTVFKWTRHGLLLGLPTQARMGHGWIGLPWLQDVYQTNVLAKLQDVLGQNGHKFNLLFFNLTVLVTIAGHKMVSQGLFLRQQNKGIHV